MKPPRHVTSNLLQGVFNGLGVVKCLYGNDGRLADGQSSITTRLKCMTLIQFRINTTVYIPFLEGDQQKAT